VIRRLPALTGLLVIGVAAAIVFGPPASAHPLELASTTTAVQQVTVGDNSALLPILVDHLAPGSTATARFEVHRGSALTGGQFASEIADLVDDDNGCEHSESADGDTTCGAGQGELSSQLHLMQQWSAPGTDCADVSATTAGAPTLSATDGEPVMASDATSAQDTACLVVVVALPTEADNLVQSDSSRFALRIGLVDAGHEGDLTLGGGSLSSGLGNQLPFTGLNLPGRLAMAGLALLVGAVLLAAGRRPTATG
jgi:hypothetical protein